MGWGLKITQCRGSFSRKPGAVYSLPRAEESLSSGHRCDVMTVSGTKSASWTLARVKVPL